ncbi:hypothetical protein ASG31_05355 [Chryseobacterium sp. Leaf404]|uniref:response regulator transcription factor n=1 Tax=unclassified Chryseobacterium TaxID=2593645 RepID=UPI0006F40F31|nr:MULTISPECIES: response regulator [unclassified Chryseobacterium]KQT18161.1 hypothetical protein ASG31_05355 [Chryseobacterium sp. Leaf404]
MRKIYIVEDDDSIREILEIFLISEDFAVQSFETVKDFDQRNKEDKPDLYLFDVMLPDGSGIDLCTEIKTSRENAEIPVLIMSAHAQLKNFADDCQPDGFISKPFDIDHLLSQIKEIIGNRENHR